MSADSASRVLLTGATGFLGKVVLADLVRRRSTLGIEHVDVLVRPKQGRSPEERLRREIIGARCFDDADAAILNQHVDVVAGDLSEPHCGLSRSALDEQRARTTHLIHCAASVRFDLPIEKALAANTESALRVLKLAQSCRRLESMVAVSTAYVTPHPASSAPIPEQLVSLPRPPRQIYESIRAGDADEADLLAATRHPNTYTLTKCLAERLMAERRDATPLTIVRPSVICAARQFPVPAWIDSPTAYAAYGLMVGLDAVNTFPVHPSERLDVVPCDYVAETIVDRAFDPPALSRGEPPDIVHAVSEVPDALRLDTGTEAIVSYFQRRRRGAGPSVDLLSPPNTGYRLARLWYHTAPGLAKRAFLRLTGQSDLGDKLAESHDRVDHLGDQYEYFATRTFNFQSSAPLDDPTFRPKQYAQTIAEGLYRYILDRDDQCIPIAGRQHSDRRFDVSVVLRQPDGNESIRLLAYLVRKAMRRMAERVTVDWASFERAVEAKPPEALPVLVPTHRSYLDFLLTSYFLFVRPELGLSVPHIPATEEFEDMWLVGTLLERARAFYIERGAGRAQFSINRKLDALDDPSASLMFFTEGSRSRSRRFLPPKKGLLQALKRTGRRSHILPVSITYDRVPERRELETELRGNPKPPKTLTGLLRWSTRLLRGDIELGHIHLRCGRPLALDAETDASSCAATIRTRHQANMAVTRYHLRCFVDRVRADRFDVDDLAEVIEARGGRVLDSALAGRPAPSPFAERAYRFQWMHVLYPDARRLWGDHPVVRHHLRVNPYDQRPPQNGSAPNDRVRAIVSALFAPIAATYRRIGRALREHPADDPVPPPASFFGEDRGFKPYVEEAYAALAEEGILSRTAGTGPTWTRGPHFDQLQPFLERCRWPAPTGTPAPTSPARV